MFNKEPLTLVAGGGMATRNKHRLLNGTISR